MVDNCATVTAALLKECQIVRFILVRLDFMKQICASIEFQFKAFLMLPVILEKFSLTEYFDNIWY